MKTLDTSLLSLEIASVASGYKALQLATRGAPADGVRIIDASLACNRFLILATGESEALKTVVDQVKTGLEASKHDQLLDVEIVEKASEKILEALHSLAQTPLQEALIVAECESVSALTSVAQELISGHGLEVIELKIRRSGTGGAYGFFTGASARCIAGAEDVRSRLKNSMRVARIEVIESMSTEFKRFFEP
jgi:hypothetical protein